MKPIKDARLNTIAINQFQVSGSHKKVDNSNIYGLNERTPSDVKFKIPISKTASKANDCGQFSNRDSGRIKTEPLQQKYKAKAHVDPLKSNVRSQLQKLSYREKLNQIQCIFKSVRDLCKTYGYFTITQAMLQFHFQDAFKISVWIHPDRRSLKPLHPIRKQTEFQCQLVCSAQLRSVMKSIFPTVDLGDGRTFANVIGYIDMVKSDLDKQSRSTVQKFSSRKGSTKINDLQLLEKKNGNKDGTPIASMKTVPVLQLTKNNEMADNQNKIKQIQTDFKPKETSSTLIDTFKSANSIRDRLRFQLNTPSKTQGLNEKIQRKIKKKPSLMTESLDIGMITDDKMASYSHSPNQPTATNQEQESPKKRMSQIYANMKQSSTSNRFGMKTSGIGRRMMSMSIEIQSEINNLFGSNDDMALSNYYFNNDQKGVRNSVLSKVAEEFQDLF